MVTKRTDYTAEAVEAARSVMLELTRLLGEYQEGIVIVGGWVPELLLSGAGHRHSSTTYEVEVDFLAGEYAGTARSHRTQNVQDMQPRKARGCDMAFTGPTEITLSGTLPEGGKDSVRIRVASIAPFLVMKAMALASRLMEKDAWDIYYCIRNYPGGIQGLAEEFRPLLKNKLAQEALENIAEKVASPEHVGPKHVADFEEITKPEERALRQRDAYERVNALLALLR